MGEPRTIRGTNLTAAEGGGLSGPLRAWDGDGGTDTNLMSGAGCRDADVSYTYGWMDGWINPGTVQGKVEQEESLSR